MTILDILMRRRRVTLTEAERAIVIRKGRIMDILGVGEHVLRRDDVVERHDLSDPYIVSTLTDALTRERPDLVATHLTELRTGMDEIAVVSRDGRLFEVMTPDLRRVLWTDAGPWEVERVDLTGGLAVAPKLGDRLTRARMTHAMTVVEVAEADVGLMFVDGALAETLGAGVHRFWTAGRKITVKMVDLRWRAHDVTGHEILTRDRVTLRVNLAADFRVTDPVRAVTAVKDFEDALHRALGLAFRKTLGALTLDALLADKMAVDAEAANAVRAEMALIGVEVGAIALKDVILPGEMRDILTGVVAAEKEAEANVIRRREETNATRSLLNTAKVMAENPVMLRLKELEALETIAGKVERLTVHSGTDGLMNDIVRLRD
ncbi:SPFH domain-containing protein [Litoreibacter arenae]|uniref:Stomatin/prohibitin-family membrane protease subunit n=1 Tax=Litoreibacter arenae DSM 19593 TaxID=1123360 RepID=S9RGC1_9RHOB|nr:slipin family protein [Litoreibacter arenae]EPX77125.1 Putative stomatin/prohibitin-family membrane protease subunit [Litoreibacter arenae DSM 19593]